MSAFDSPYGCVIYPSINVYVFEIADMFACPVVKLLSMHVTNYLCCAVKFVQVNVAIPIYVDVRAIFGAGVGTIEYLFCGAYLGAIVCKSVFCIVPLTDSVVDIVVGMMKEIVRWIVPTVVGQVWYPCRSDVIGIKVVQLAVVVPVAVGMFGVDVLVQIDAKRLHQVIKLIITAVGGIVVGVLVHWIIQK